MKNHKSIWFIVVGIVIVIGIALFFALGEKKEDNSLSLSEKKWIENNKKKIIDVYITNNIPIFTMQGEGIFLNFLDYFESNTGLELNKASYNASNNSNSAYSFKIVDEKTELKTTDLLFYEDNFVILSKNNDKIVNINSLIDKKIGVVNTNLQEVSNYLRVVGSITYVTYDSYDDMLSKFSSGDVDYIVVPKNQYLDVIISENYYIVYTLSALYNKYVLSVNGEEKELNSIFTKQYKEWYKNNYNKLYIEEMNKFYFDLSNIDEKKESAFKSRIYIYGYIDNLPYETQMNGDFYGINREFLKGFEAFSTTQFKFKKYDSVKDLEDAFNDGKVDIVFNYYNFGDLKDATYTIQTFSGNYVLLSHINNNVTIDSFASLKGKEIYTIKDTKLSNYVNQNSGATIKAYNKINNLLKNKEPLMLLDLNMYNYYKSSKLKDYYIVYEDRANVNYNFAIRKDDVNDIFAQVFQFYLTNINHKEVTNRGMYNLLNTNILKEISYVYYILTAILAIIVAIIINKKRKIRKSAKDDRVKYIDHLTSLKNRTYLTEHINKWDNNRVYPQAIIIIDLNKLKDVNNNFGYEEGDRLIKTAANILINNQLENTDIIRSDGNEFLIYMVGYEESQVIAYMRKLYKLMKELPYEHGATLGYSMINDDVKLIEDAINEATLDMVTNKEVRSNE